MFVDFEISLTGHARNDTNLKDSYFWACTFLGIGFCASLSFFMLFFPTVPKFFLFADFEILETGHLGTALTLTSHSFA